MSTSGLTIFCPYCLKVGEGGSLVPLGGLQTQIELESGPKNLSFHYCPQCNGRWVSPQVLADMIIIARELRKGDDIPERVRDMEEKPYLQCPYPNCGEMLSRSGWSSSQSSAKSRGPTPIVDSCIHGHGMWLDSGELQWLLDCSLGT